MENPTYSFREKNLVLQLKSKTVMCWSSRKKKGHFLYLAFCPKNFFLTFVFNLNVKYIGHTFRIYILLHIEKHYFINFCCLLLKSSKAFSISLLTILTGKNRVFLNSLQESIEREAWLLLTFFTCLHNQLSSKHYIVTY